MKKLFLSIVMIIGFSVFCNAQTVPTVQTNQAGVKVSVAVSEEDGYQAVKMEELSQVVQDAIKNNYTDLTVKALAYNAEKKLTKVTFVTANGENKVVILNEEGKEFKE
jgi:hypothetical protein